VVEDERELFGGEVCDTRKAAPFQPFWDVQHAADASGSRLAIPGLRFYNGDWVNIPI
jgi:hypothetical protein